MDLTSDPHDACFEIQRRRESLSPDIPGELRLSLRSQLLFVHASPLLDRLLRIVVDPRPARRRDDDGDRIGLRAVLDDGRQFWLGEASGVFASTLSISGLVCCCRIDTMGQLAVRHVPIESTLAADATPRVSEPGTIADVARHFSTGASSVASTAQPGNPEPDVPLLHRLRRIVRSAAVAAA